MQPYLLRQSDHNRAATYIKSHFYIEQRTNFLKKFILSVILTFMLVNWYMAGLLGVLPSYIHSNSPS